MPSIEVFDRKKHQREHFDCGVDSLNTFLKAQARQQQDQNFAVVYVLTEDGSSIAAYSTLNTYTLDMAALDPEKLKKLPRYGYVPAMLLGRLAVDTQHKGKRYGELLLLHAMKRTLEVSKQVACHMLVVDALDDQASRFYQKYGFSPLPSRPHTLVMRVSDIEQLMG